jgi:hypothetical protein
MNFGLISICVKVMDKEREESAYLWQKISQNK